MDIYKLIGRSTELFVDDLVEHDSELKELIRGSRVLIIGGAGTIGQAVVREIFKRMPSALHVVDISENNMVELVRDIRSTLGYGVNDFKTYAIDSAGLEFEYLVRSERKYDYIFNLSALKHVRSEKDPYTLMRMLDVNIFNTIKLAGLAKSQCVKKFFCVSTDKAANPVNMMGASKRIMEMFLMRESSAQPISMARFANVAFSDGSLLHGFSQRISKRQPIAAPSDVQRYFISQKESGELCMLSAILGNNRDIYFPKLSQHLHLISFSDIAINYLSMMGYEAFECDSEEEARSRFPELVSQRRWPCYFFTSDTTGEKDFEEFFTEKEVLDLNRYKSIGVIENIIDFNPEKLDFFVSSVSAIRRRQCWSKDEILDLFLELIPGFLHKETGKYLDQRM